MTEKSHAEKLKDARETVVWYDELPFEHRAAALAEAGYFLMGEVDRLSGLESKIHNAIMDKKLELDQLEDEIELCIEKGWDEGLERLREREWPAVHAQIRVLESLLEG